MYASLIRSQCRISPTYALDCSDMTSNSLIFEDVHTIVCGVDAEVSDYKSVDPSSIPIFSNGSHIPIYLFYEFKATKDEKKANELFFFFTTINKFCLLLIKPLISLSNNLKPAKG